MQYFTIFQDKLHSFNIQNRTKHAWAFRKTVQKISRSEFLQSSFIFVIYLLKEVYRKIMSEVHFVGKTRYEDLTETAS